MRGLRLPVLCALGGLAAGCQVYMSGGPSYDPPPPPYDAATPADDTAIPTDTTGPEHATISTPPPIASAEEAATAQVSSASATSAVTPPPAQSQRVASGATFPGERYYRAGEAWVIVDAVEDALESRGFQILRSGTSSRGGEVHAERRERVTPAPRTTSTEKWLVRAAVVQVTGSTWEDCCYVKANFTTTSTSARGDVLGTTPADDPENDVLRGWFFEDLTARVPPPPLY